MKSADKLLALASALESGTCPPVTQRRGSGAALRVLVEELEAHRATQAPVFGYQAEELLEAAEKAAEEA